MVLTLTNVSKTYGTNAATYKALNNVSLTMEKGEFVGIMGPSGAGKTTLLNLIATIDQPTSGTIELAGKNIAALSDQQLAQLRGRELGFVFQDYNLLPTLTVEENIILPLALANVKHGEMQRRLAPLAEQFQITSLLAKYPHELSGGQKQRTAAARALIHGPTLLLADEPTGALDSKSATDLLQMMATINEQQKASILMVTHDPFAASYCKRIIFIKDGERFTELHRGQSRQQFFQQIMNVLSALGGGSHDLV